MFSSTPDDKSLPKATNIYTRPPLLILVGAVILSSLAFWNGYPIIFGDSAGYIQRAVSNTVSIHWASLYSGFIELFSLNFYSLWGVILAQNLILSYLLYRISTYFFKGKRLATFFLVLVASLLITTLPWLSNALMADIFYPLGALAFFILLMEEKMNAHFIFSLCLFSISITIHSANKIMLPLVAVAALVPYILLYKKAAFSFRWRMPLIFLAIIFSVFFLNNFSNLLIAGFKMDKKTTKVSKNLSNSGGYSKVLHHFNRVGGLRPLLEKYCDEYQFILCENYEKAVRCNEPGIETWRFLHSERGIENELFVKYARDAKIITQLSLKDPAYWQYHAQYMLTKGLTLFNAHNIPNQVLRYEPRMKIRSNMSGAEYQRLLSGKQYRMTDSYLYFYNLDEKKQELKNTGIIQNA